MLMPFSRFSSVFLEPGHLGMMASFFLCANRFELKRKEILTIFIATIFTFSLAAYLLLLISAFVFLTIYSKKPIRNFIAWGLLLFLFYSFFSTYDKGENVINIFIFERLQTDNGKIAGDNRFSEEMDIYYKRFVNTDEIISGIGLDRFSKTSMVDSAGYKGFIVTYGIIGTLLVLLFYLSLVLGHQSKMAWILFLVYILCFLQAAYPLWECELLLFITAIPFFKLIREQNKRLLEKGFQTNTFLAKQ